MEPGTAKKTRGRPKVGGKTDVPVSEVSTTEPVEIEVKTPQKPIKPPNLQNTPLSETPASITPVKSRGRSKTPKSRQTKEVTHPDSSFYVLSQYKMLLSYEFCRK